MKKTKQIEYHTCDFCGKKCDPTPQYHLPQFELYPACECYGDWRVVPKQLDVCEKCEEKIAGMLDRFQETMLSDNDLSSEATIQLYSAESNQKNDDSSEK